MRDLKRFLPAIVLLVGCGSILHTRTQNPVPLVAPLSTVSPDFGAGYKPVDQVLTKEEIAVAGMTEYSARAYMQDSLAAFTTLVSYYDRQTQGRTIHSPRNCLPGSGWEILTPGTRELQAGPARHVVNRYVLKNGGMMAVVLYWYQGRGRVVADEYAVKWNLLRDAALTGHTEEALVRVFVPIYATPGVSEEAAMTAADSLANHVAGRLLVSVDQVLPKS